MKNWRFLIPVLFLLSTNIVLGTSKIIDKIVAIVNHDIILHSDIENKIRTIQHDAHHISNKKLEQNTVLYQQILNQLITHRLIFQTAKHDNIHSNYDQVHNTINTIAKQHNMTIDQYKKYLNNIGINYNKYLTQIYEEKINKTICEDKIHQCIHISKNDINQIVQELNSIDFHKQFKLIHITITLPIQPINIQINQINQLAQLLIEKYKIYGNIEQLVDNYSEKIISQIITIQKTPWITWKDVPTIFDPFLQKIQKKNIIGPIYSYDGIHLLIIEDIRNMKFTFPIIQTKIKCITVNNTSTDSDIIKKLLNIKNNIERGKIIYQHNNHQTSPLFHIKDYEENLKWKNIDHFEPIIQETLLSLKKNEISTPIHTSFGWCLIQLIDLKSLDYITVMHERAHSYLLQKKFNKTIKNWVETLKNTAYIKIITK